ILRSMSELFDGEEFTIFIDGSELTFNNNKDGLKKLLEEDQLLEKFINENLESETSNAGVFLIPKKYRNRENYDYLIYLTNRYMGNTKFGDQSIINLWLLKNGISGNPDIRFNLQTTLLRYPHNHHKFQDAYFLHFVWLKPLSKE